LGGSAGNYGQTRVWFPTIPATGLLLLRHQRNNLPAGALERQQLGWRVPASVLTGFLAHKTHRSPAAGAGDLLLGRRISCLLSFHEETLLPKAGARRRLSVTDAKVVSAMLG